MFTKTTSFVFRLFSMFMLLTLLVGAVGVTPARAAGIRYATPTGTGDCSSWANACMLQTALTGAVSGDEIWVLAGTYKPTAGTDRSATFLLNGVAVYGGFAGTETIRSQRNPATNVTTLSGDLLGNDNSYVKYDELTRADNSYHVVTGTNNITLDGFTITAGNAYVSSSDCPFNCGGGMYNNPSSSPTLTNVIFSGNSAFYGGGMYNNPNSNPMLTNVTFSGNSAYGGGGMYNNHTSNTILTNVTFASNSVIGDGGGILNYHSSPILTSITFSDNSAQSGGGMYNETSNPILTNVTFTVNSAGGCGGGMYNVTGSNPTMTNSTFSGNSAQGGGGIYNQSSSPTMTNITFSGNSAQSGGGMYNVWGSGTLINVTFSNNAAGGTGVYGYGGGMYNYNSNLTLTNVTFSTNTAGSIGVYGYGGGMGNYSSNPTLINVTFGANSAQYGGGIYNDSSNPTLTNVTISGNSVDYSGGGIYNTSSSPAIVNTIFWGNTASSAGAQIYNYDIASSPVVNDSVVQGGYAGGTNIITANPLLGTLGDYGGFTQTIPLLSGSSAINTGNDATCAATDQRGITRPQGAHCDIGAYEVEYIDTTKPVVNTFTATTPFNSLNIPITAFIASDDVGVTGYQITTSATPPAAGAAGWTGTAPTTYTVASDGSYTLYPWAKDAGGNVSAVFGSPVPVVVYTTPPTATTNAASAITSTGATLNGTVNANNASSTVTFEYGLTTSYGNTVTADQSPVTGTTNTAVSKAVTGLAINTTYHYRVKAVNSAGTTYGSDLTFTTSAIAPTATTDAASAITSTGATLNGTVNANNASSTVTFEYGLTTSYGNTVTADQSPVTGITNTAVSKVVTGLAINTTYHYRVKAVNSAGTTYGSDQTFTTIATAPTATTNAASSITSTGATLNGTVNANNASSTVTFEYGLTTSYGNAVTVDQSPVTGITNTAVSKVVTGLTSNTIYHYRVVATNSIGTTNGNDLTFLTLTNPNSPPTNIMLSKASVAENKPIGTVIGSLSATDPDVGDTHTFTLQSGVVGCSATNNASFQISGNQLKTNAIFDYETKNSYNICIRANDGKGGTFDKSFAITVTNVFDETTKNGGFNTYAGTSKIPMNWVKSATFASTDGKDTTVKKEGTASVKITGNGKTKTLTQTLALSGKADDKFTFTFWAKGASIPVAGLCQAQVLLYSGSTLKLTKTISCTNGTYASFQKKTLTFNATSAYTQVVIKFTFSKASGTVWFDLVSLLR